MSDDVKPKILGVDRRSMAHELFGHIDWKVVLVEGQCGDYAAYRGCGSDEFVARLGNKLTFAEALAHFPRGLTREKYRDD